MAINVVVHGVLGKMGQQVLDAVTNESGLAPVAGADKAASTGSIPLPDRSGEIPISGSLSDVLSGADVVVDFTNAEGDPPHLQDDRLGIRREGAPVVDGPKVADPVPADTEAVVLEVGVVALRAPDRDVHSDKAWM